MNELADFQVMTFAKAVLEERRLQSLVLMSGVKAAQLNW